MRIVIDGRMLGWTGIGRYTRQLLLQLEQLDHETDYVVIMQPADAKIWQPLQDNFSVIWAKIPPYSFAEQLRLPRLLASLQPDLVHFPHFTVPLFYNRSFVVTVHDMTLVDFKNYRGTGILKILYDIKYAASRLVLTHAVRRAQIVLSPTHYVKDRLAAHYHISPDHFSAIALGVESLSDIKVASTNRKPFIFSLGNSYRYKNLERLIQAFAASDFRTRGGELVLGGPEDSFRVQLRDYVAKHKLGKGVVFIGRVSDAELAGLYQEAQMYVFPSLSEGFGLPGLEAMKYGAPVLAAEASCLPEVYGEAARYFDPQSITDLTSKIDNLASDETERVRLSLLGSKRIKRFSWKATAEQTLAAYRVAIRTATQKNNS